MYCKRDETYGKCVIVLTEVDDLVITGSDTDGIMELRAALIAEMATKDRDGIPDATTIHWEPINSFLGIDINYDPAKGIFRMSNRAKVDEIFDSPEHKDVLKKIGHASTPMEANFFSQIYDNDTKLSDLDAHLKKHYASIVGSLIYITITVRVDISHVVGKLARGMHNPQYMHIVMLKRALKYLNGHRDVPLIYERDSAAQRHLGEMFRDASGGASGKVPDLFNISTTPSSTDLGVTGFSDANFSQQGEKCRSTSGYAYFYLGQLVSWKSKLQAITAGSTHEAELVALSFCCDEGLWLRRICGELAEVVSSPPVECVHVQFPEPDKDVEKALAALDDAGAALPDSNYDFDVDDDEYESAENSEANPTTIYVDNQGTVATANNPTSSTKSARHIDRRYFQVRDHIKNGRIKVIFCRTADNLADFFTKSMPVAQFNSLKNRLMGTKGVVGS